VCLLSTDTRPVLRIPDQVTLHVQYAMCLPLRLLRRTVTRTMKTKIKYSIQAKILKRVCLETDLRLFYLS
jgi:hypothetical protein